MNCRTFSPKSSRVRKKPPPPPLSDSRKQKLSIKALPYRVLSSVVLSQTAIQHNPFLVQIVSVNTEEVGSSVVTYDTEAH